MKPTLIEWISAFVITKINIQVIEYLIFNYFMQMFNRIKIFENFELYVNRDLNSNKNSFDNRFNIII